MFAKNFQLKSLLLLSLSLFCTFCYSQNDSELANIEILEYFKHLKYFNADSLKEKKFKHFTIEIPNYHYNHEIKRDFNILENRFNFTVKLSDSKWSPPEDYEVRILKRDTLFIGIISQSFFTDPKLYFNQEQLDLFVKDHNNFYNTSLTAEVFIEDLLKFEVYTYFCGYSPVFKEIPEYGEFKFNDIKSLNIFTSLLKSPNLELQTYGVDALEYLAHATKYKIPKDLKRLIKHIKRRNSLVNTCSGCEIGFYRKVF